MKRGARLSAPLRPSTKRSASARTSSATTAKPRPASPARAASTLALSASRLVWNAISSIVIVGAILQTGSLSWTVTILAALCVFMTGINIVGGFMVTQRMLRMFHR